MRRWTRTVVLVACVKTGTPAGEPLSARQMPKWLQGMFVPTLLLWLYAIALGIATGLQSYGILPSGADLSSRMALSLVMAFWVTADARKRRRALCYDYDSFVFFAWPIVMPIYLIQTRGWRALLTLLCFIGIWMVVILVARVTWHWRFAELP